MIKLQVLKQGGPVEVRWIELTREIQEFRSHEGVLMTKGVGKEWIRAEYDTGHVFLGVKVDWNVQAHCMMARPWSVEEDGAFPPEIAGRPRQDTGYVYTRSITAPLYPGSRPAKDGPSADQALHKMWRELRNGASPEKVACVIGAIAMANVTGLLTDDQAEGWKVRIGTCPGHDDEGARDWCAYGCAKEVIA